MQSVTLERKQRTGFGVGSALLTWSSRWACPLQSVEIILAKKAILATASFVHEMYPRLRTFFDFFALIFIVKWSFFIAAV
jgi:hypothetical protein